jgi:flagellar hook-associated protein 3 FlgL
MRIADKMAFEQVQSNVAKNRSTMSDLQNQAATQKRVTKPSDDPLAAARVLSNRVDLQGNKQFTKSLNYARSFLEFTDQSLSEITDALMRAKELAVSQANDASASGQSRKVVATEVNQLYNQLIQVGNRKLGDRFIFGGYKTQAAPFDPQAQYVGDGGEMMIHVDKEAFIPMNVPGSRVFFGEGFSPEGFHFSTPDQAMTIEELHAQLHPPTDEAVPDETGLRSPASLDLKGAETKITSTANSVLFQAGTRTDSGVNLFRVLGDFETALRTNDKSGIQDSLNLLDQAIEQVVLTRAQVGSRSQTLDHSMQTMERSKVDNQIAISTLEDADIYATVSDINKTESTLQATLQTSGKMIQKSLMDFIR